MPEPVPNPGRQRESTIREVFALKHCGAGYHAVTPAVLEHPRGSQPLCHSLRQLNYCVSRCMDTDCREHLAQSEKRCVFKEISVFPDFRGVYLMSSTVVEMQMEPEILNQKLMLLVHA